jgi:hypothetical protein
MSDAAIAETTTCGVVVLGVKRLLGAGRVVALASAEIQVGDIAVRLHSIGVVAFPGGRLAVELPASRDATGQTVAAIELPIELAHAVAAQVLRA